jgi:hypothetical protein
MNRATRPPCRAASPERDVGATALGQRWQRIGLGIRLAYNPQQPAAIRCWLGIGAKLGADGSAAELALLQKSLRLLMQSAHDEALPWYWRSVCLEHTARPLARLTTLLNLHDPLAAHLLHESVDDAHRSLAARYTGCAALRPE